MPIQRRHLAPPVRVALPCALAALTAFAAATTVGGCGSRGAPTAPPGASRAARTFPSRGYVTLARGAHALARREWDIGALDPARRLENLSIVFKLPPKLTAERDALVTAVSDPGSPSYHQWLTPETYGARFGAAPDDVARTAAWLAEQGLEVGETSRLGARLSFAGTVEKIQAAFHAELRRYQVGREVHYAMASAPSVPAELADVVLGVHNTHDFYKRPATTKMEIVTPESICPDNEAGVFCGQGTQGIAPPDWAAIYDAAPLYATNQGQGVTIVVVGTSTIAQTDLDDFKTRYGLASPPIAQTVVPGTGAGGEQGGTGVEAVLDVEWANGVAPGANVHYVTTGVGDANIDDAAYYAIEQDFGGVLSESWGTCEASFTPADADILEIFGSAASLLGITYVAASGDLGATSCAGYGVAGLYVNLPAASPGVTSVGGTGFAYPGGLTFNASGVATGYGSEAAWNEQNDPNAGALAASGGGVSVVFSRPQYQALLPDCAMVGALPITGIDPHAMRQVPDVAFNAGGGTTQYGTLLDCTVDPVAGDCVGSDAAAGHPQLVQVGGTSASTPAFAGVVALASHATKGRIGNINPLLYALPSTGTSSVFHDVAAGDNEIKCTTGTDPGCPATGGVYGYPATKGFDCATGMGSLDVDKMVTAMGALLPTATTLAVGAGPIDEGQSVVVSASITATSGVAAIGGAVTFAFQSYLSNGAIGPSWSIDTTPITAGTPLLGTATATLVIPPGMVDPGSQLVDVVAEFGGDATHVGSASAKHRVAINPVSFCVTPSATTAAPGASFTIAAGSALPSAASVSWTIVEDGTCGANGINCSTVNASTGAFVAGTGSAGYVLVAAKDGDGAVTFSEITVGAASGTPPWSAGIVAHACPAVADAGLLDAGSDAAPAVDAGQDSGAPVDAGGEATAPVDSGNDSAAAVDSGGDTGAGSSSGGGAGDGAVDGAGDGGASVGAGSSGGCGCTTAGQKESAPGEMLAGILLGFGLIVRRRRAA